MRTQRCKDCNGTYCYDDYGPAKECNCPKIEAQKVFKAGRKKVTDRIRAMANEVLQSHIETPEQMYVTWESLDAILTKVENDVPE